MTRIIGFPTSAEAKDMVILAAKPELDMISDSIIRASANKQYSIEYVLDDVDSKLTIVKYLQSMGYSVDWEVGSCATMTISWK